MNVGMNLHYVAIPFILAAIILLCDIYLVYKRNFRRFCIGYLLIFVGFVAYVLEFLLNDFTLLEVFSHSSSALPVSLKLSASWSGSGGYILWWLFIFTVIVSIKRLKVKELGDLDKKRLMVYNVVIISLFLIALLNGAFDCLHFKPADGQGLNPLLKSVWMYFHPPATFVGYALALFAAIDVFFSRHNAFLISLAWLFITIANILGAVWSYFTLGWGGYWAWDPVETSLLLPWLTLTAYFHFEKLKNFFLSLTGFSIAFAAFVTRGGVSVLHGFAISYAGVAIIVVGIPFLIKAIREFRFDTNDLKDARGLTVFSLLCIYMICFLGLLHQCIQMATSQRVAINVDYYNYLSVPFVVIFLLALPACSAKIKRYPLIIFGTLTFSTFLAELAALGFISWCKSSPPITNAIISFLIPVSLLSFLGVLNSFIKKISRSIIGLKLVHISIPILIIGVALSGPYTYHQNLFKSAVVEKGEKVDYGDLKIEFLDSRFIGPEGRVSIAGFTSIPEESSAEFLLKINDNNCVSSKIRLNLALYLRGREYMISEPSVLNCGFGEYYFVIPTIYSFDLLMFHSKYIYQHEKNDLVLKLLAKSLNLNRSSFINELNSWSEEKSHVKRVAVILYKYIPYVNLVWFSLILMVLGEILNLVVRKK